MRVDAVSVIVDLVEIGFADLLICCREQGALSIVVVS